MKLGQLIALQTSANCYLPEDRCGGDGTYAFVDATTVKKCPFCGTTNNIKIMNSKSIKCKNCGKVYE